MLNSMSLPLFVQLILSLAGLALDWHSLLLRGGRTDPDKEYPMGNLSTFRIWGAFRVHDFVLPGKVKWQLAVILQLTSAKANVYPTSTNAETSGFLELYVRRVVCSNHSWWMVQTILPCFWSQIYCSQFQAVDVELFFLDRLFPLYCDVVHLCAQSLSDADV